MAVKVLISLSGANERTYRFQPVPILSRFPAAKTRKSSEISKISVGTGRDDVRDASGRTKTGVMLLCSQQLRDSGLENQDIIGTFSRFSSFSLKTKDFSSRDDTFRLTHSRKSLLLFVTARPGA